MTKQVLGRKLNKTNQISYWDRRPLRDSYQWPVRFRINAAVSAYHNVRLNVEQSGLSPVLNKLQERNSTTCSVAIQKDF